MLRTLRKVSGEKKRVIHIISRVRKIIEEDPTILNDKDVRKWLRLIYPLLLEHGSVRDKEFFKMLYPDLFD